ncbi:carboxylesterase/lipase family protein [Mesorhizobium sp. ES1-4]|uniref:carboxylesterase/lipase family protein n=1 Tax=Mesorhizobium sp. ES1-4 TaxID=2876627 RepID=UPI001CD02920|nr:carboxylesterase family protein [Mesorhizobium sp. ES1-4]MBZ9798446.1 carboxylesterase family protein [Mesorhizobium sp. ES1-4]
MYDTELVELSTPFGKLRGAKREGVVAFHGVPYAEAPVGPRRFKMPVAPVRWPGVRDAITAGPIPPQLPSRLDDVMGAYAADQSEDCLHLDIWTTHTEGNGAPVLVFIHGGGFMTGGGSLPCYDGSVLARENGLVVVTISYRLGILGLWPQLDFGGLNLALHDQLAALRWIKAAIGTFGGDPARITVAGQSAGAFSIATHLGATDNSELFARAIMMSAPVGIKLRTADQSRPAANAILEAFGLRPEEANKLQTMPIVQVLDGLRSLAKRPPAVKGDITPPFMPTLDDGLLPRQPLETIRSGTANWCDVMIGVTREEFSAFSAGNPALDKLSEDELKALFEAELGDEASATIVKICSERVPATPRTILGDFHTDAIFGKSLEIASVQSRLGRKAYGYSFDWQSPKSAFGACHCIDLPFLFGNIDTWKAAPMLAGADEQEVADLSQRFRGAIAAFAANGDPNGPGLPRWPAFGPNRAALHFDRHISAFAAA